MNHITYFKAAVNSKSEQKTCNPSIKIVFMEKTHFTYDYTVQIQSAL